MRKSILYCASTVSHLLNFHIPYLQFFHDKGWKVDVIAASKAEIPFVDNVIVLPLEKNLLSVNNLRAVYSVKCLLVKNHYDIISAHTTLAGVVIRFALKMIGEYDGKVVYTSHGYFFNGEDIITKWPYLWIEKLLAPVTDLLMVMNKIDYDLAQKHKLCEKIINIPGMGLDITKFVKLREENKKQLRVNAGYDPDDFLLVYAAEMSKRKNQGELVRAFSVAAAQVPSLKLLLAGEGLLKHEYEEMVRKLGLGERIRFLGQVSNMAQVYSMCDAAVSSSCSEGLPFNVMEAMASGLPVVASNIKGHKDLLDRTQKDLLYKLGNEQVLAELLLRISKEHYSLEKIGKDNMKIVQQYGNEKVRQEIIKIYNELIEKPIN